MPGTIVVIPTEGLANRIRIIASSFKLARESGKKLCVYWHLDVGLNAEFKNLFYEIEALPVKKVPVKYKIWMFLNIPNPRLRFLNKWYLKILNFGFTFFDSNAQQLWDKKINLLEEANKTKNIFISSCQELNYFDIEDYKIFIPQPEILKIIDAISQNFTSNTIGIHIRSTDHQWAKKHSPLWVFADKMQEEINTNPGINFFVSTDNMEYQEKLLQKFGRDKIIFHEKDFSRNTSKGIVDAVIDIFCLSRTSKIYGSYLSSFSEIAGRIGDTEVETLRVKYSD